jgi:hypothetical protein
MPLRKSIAPSVPSTALHLGAAERATNTHRRTERAVAVRVSNESGCSDLTEARATKPCRVGSTDRSVAGTDGATAWSIAQTPSAWNPL